MIISVISGTAGLTDSCILTGTAGFNICGITLQTNRDLQGASLQRQLTDKHYLIIDEMSMIGQKTLAWVDKRLRQGTGKLNSILKW